jgi:hypothetical protein
MKKDLLTRQKCVSLTEAEENILELLAGVSGMTQSSYLRMAFVDKAVALKAMPHPMAAQIAAYEAAQKA